MSNYLNELMNLNESNIAYFYIIRQKIKVAEVINPPTCDSPIEIIKGIEGASITQGSVFFLLSKKINTPSASQAQKSETLKTK